MNGVFHIGATGLHAQDRALNIVANNITNMNTPGFKRAEARFAEMVGTAGGADPATGAPAGSAPMFGVSADAGERIFQAGDMHETGNAMDIAIRGDGFVELAGPDGQTLLWRGGRLGIGPDGSLTGAGGLPLKAMISVPNGATNLTIDASGEIRAVSPGETEARSIGRIELVTVRDMAGLSDVDGGLYRAAADEDLVAMDVDNRSASILQGSIEQSNVQLTDEMVRLMMMQRAYAASAQVVQAGDQLMAIANGLKR